MSHPRMHADEVGTDADLVRRLVAAQFPRWAHLPVTPVVSSGTENAVYRLGPDLVARLPRIPGAVGGGAAERRWLPRLAPHLPVAVPLPLAHGEPGEGFPWPWTVLRWLDGENPAVGRVTAPDLLATGLARFVTALRAVDPADGPPSRRGAPLATEDHSARAAIAKLRALAAAGTPEGRDGRAFDLDAVTAAWDESAHAPAYEGPPAWSHGDLLAGNVLVAPDGRLTAVIDFACTGTGDPSVDLMAAWTLLPASARPLFRDLTGADDAAWARARAWALVVSLNQLPYYRETNPVLAAGARHTLGEILAERGA
ncbi:aminoglycoside phosphotransferase family protein [Streptomyces avicenniae]|uniref:aminoglycoside phosphotransferase family protein n=1 Tax=Streptomyces avicenniae TaxID=500153 RepID=UPI000699405C|nr:aminoglycoside phosphotransferase family protein [Streptomyces avicenniae]